MTAPPYAHPSRRSGTTTEPFFDLMIPEHAYLFGLLQSDGSHTAGERNRGRVALEVASRDEHILHKLVALVPWYSSVRTRNRDTNFKDGYTTASWTLSSWDARTELTALGLPPGRKATRIAPPPAAISVRDYVRGLVDGDGSVGFTGRGHPFLSFVTASESMARFFEAFGAQITGLDRRTSANARDGVFNPMYQNEAAVDLARHLYRPGDLALDRKAQAVEQMATWTRPPGMRRRYTARRWTEDEDARVLACHTPADRAQLAAELYRSASSVTMRHWRLTKRP